MKSDIYIFPNLKLDIYIAYRNARSGYLEIMINNVYNLSKSLVMH